MTRIRGYYVKSGTSAFHLQALIVVCTILLIQNDLTVPAQQEFVSLAKSFLEGHLYLTASSSLWYDTAYYHGHYYWPLGPLPAIILLPFVAFFGLAVRQEYFLVFCNLINLFLLYNIGQRITQNQASSLWLSFAYVFSTEYLNIACVPWSSYFAQAVATTFLLLALYEFLHGTRWWLIGVYTALGVATRVNIIIASVFFYFSILFEHGNRNILESGYGLQSLYGGLAVNREYGLWSLVHFPGNLYYFFLRGPVGVFIPGTKVLTYPYLRYDGWGMSILFTSPIFFWLVKAPWKNTVVQLSALTSILMFSVFLGYYGIGFKQYGYRYALDFYPFLFLILAYAVRQKFTLSMKLVALTSFVLNWYLMSFMG
jgi:hypothetical protein